MAPPSGIGRPDGNSDVRLREHSSSAPHGGLVSGMVSLAAILLLTALSIDLAATRWGSYLPTGVPNLYLPDLLLLLAALLSTLGMLAGFRVENLRAAVAAGTLPTLYVGLRTVEAHAQPPDSVALWVRDVAPFAYLALIPLLLAAAQVVRFATLLRVLRWASATLALITAGVLSGLLSPVDIGTEMPAFAPRPDADDVVLGIGIVAYGDWGSDGRPRRTFQVAFALLAAMNYSRAGFLAAALCVTVAVFRERRRPEAPLVLSLATIASGLAGLVLLLAPGLSAADLGVRPPQAVQRLLESDVERGTTGARVRAWEEILAYTRANDDLLLGAGPGEQPILRSGAVDYLSGSTSVRAAHSWPISAVAYHGVIGLAIWLVAYGRVLRGRGSTTRVLAVTGLIAYFVASLFGVIVEIPFGSLPMAILAAWLLAHEPAGMAAATRAADSGRDLGRADL